MILRKSWNAILSLRKSRLFIIVLFFLLLINTLKEW